MAGDASVYHPPDDSAYRAIECFLVRHYFNDQIK